MEVRFENGWADRGWSLVPRLNPWSLEFDSSVRYITPAVEVIENKHGYHFYFEMPGLKQDSIDARVEEGRLIVAAERKRPEWPGETEVHLTERGYGTLRRAFELPNDASPDKIEASYKDGVLEVTVEKKPESKSAKIQIN
jgi:HSP20 family protein